MSNVVLALKERLEAGHLAEALAALAEPGMEVDVVHVVEAGSPVAAQTAGEAAAGKAVDLLRRGAWSRVATCFRPRDTAWSAAWPSRRMRLAPSSSRWGRAGLGTWAACWGAASATGCSRPRTCRC